MVNAERCMNVLEVP
jgi:ABC-type multidrug transport system fused ATPase/permease subunit